MPQILTPEQCEAAQYVVGGDDFTTIANHMNIDRKTLYNWRQLPEFQAEIDRIVKQMRDGLADRLIRLADRSLEVIEQGLLNGDRHDRSSRARDTLRMLGIQNFVLPGSLPAQPEDNKTL